MAVVRKMNKEMTAVGTNLSIAEHDWGIQREPIDTITTIAIHHAGDDLTVEQVNSLHRTGQVAGINGGIGYHFYIEKDGTVHRGNPETMIGAHVYQHNRYTLGISHQGNFNNEQPTDAQWNSLVKLVAYLCAKYSITPSRSTIKGHREFSGHESNDCPGNNLYSRLDELVLAVSNTTVSNVHDVTSSGNFTQVEVDISKSSLLWIDCVELIKKGLEKSGLASTAGLDLFPKICYLYVALMNDIKTSSFDGDSGWAFPFTDDIINENGEKAVYVTGRYGEQRSTHQHEGVDLQTGDNYSNPDKDVPFVAVKDGTVMDVNDTNWCNCIYVAHPDGTFSRYLHCRRALVSMRQQVKKGEKIGIVGGSDGSNERAYPVHLHIEFGNQIAGKTPYEHTIGDNCGIDPLDCWRKPDNNDATSGYPCWTLR